MSSTRRATSSSGWPALEKVRAVSSPMPELAPVMMTKGFDMVTAICDLYDFQSNTVFCL